MSLNLLREWLSIAGEVYGSEDQAQFFHTLIKMQKPDVVLELGTALGVTSFLMAQAVKENGSGHVFTVDNGMVWRAAAALFDRGGQVTQTTGLAGEAEVVFRGFVRRLAACPAFHDAMLRNPSLLETPHRIRSSDLRGYTEFLNRMADVLGVQSYVTFLDGTLFVEDAIPIRADSYPFLAPVLEKPIDLLFADCGHSPVQVMGLLAQFLTRLSPDASIFFDSAATYLPAYLTLQETVRQLNRGKVPAILLAGADEHDRAHLFEIAATRQFTLVPIVERKGRAQNGLVWLQMCPANVIPYPLTTFRGLSCEPSARIATPSETVASYLETGRWEGRRPSLYDSIR